MKIEVIRVRDCARVHNLDDGFLEAQAPPSMGYKADIGANSRKDLNSAYLLVVGR